MFPSLKGGVETSGPLIFVMPITILNIGLDLKNEATTSFTQVVTLEFFNFFNFFWLFCLSHNVLVVIICQRHGLQSSKWLQVQN